MESVVGIPMEMALMTLEKIQTETEYSIQQIVKAHKEIQERLVNKVHKETQAHKEILVLKVHKVIQEKQASKVLKGM